MTHLSLARWQDDQRGFTLIEVLIIAPILMLTIVIMLSFLFNQYGQLSEENAEINLQVEAQNIVFSMQDDIFYADAFTSTMNSNLQDPYAPTSGWSSNTSPPTLIISSPALTASHRDANRQTVYINTLGCTSDVLETNQVSDNNIIYFASGTNLYKRIVTAPSTVATCGTSYIKQSCPAAHTTSSCPADRLVSDHFNSLNLTYYDSNNNITTTPEQATKVTVNLQLKDRAYADDLYANSSITLKRFNQ